MDLRHVRTFVAVVEAGSVSKAALLLRIAQPALSRQICDLEQKLGFKLFDRVGRRLLLTREGEHLLGDCRGLLNYATALGERAQVLRRGDTGVLRVAASPQHIESVLSKFLHCYAKRYPNVEVKVTEAAGRDILAMLERGEIHLGQNLGSVLPPDDHRFESLVLGQVELLAAGHTSVSFDGRTSIDISRLEAHPLLLMDSAFVVRRTFDAACRLAGMKPKIKMESRTPHALLALAEEGHGIAIIPSQLRTRGYKLRIVSITYRGKVLCERMIILRDKRRPLATHAQDYCDMLAEYVRETFPITGPSPLEARRRDAKPRQ